MQLVLTVAPEELASLVHKVHKDLQVGRDLRVKQVAQVQLALPVLKEEQEQLVHVVR